MQQMQASIEMHLGLAKHAEMWEWREVTNNEARKAKKNGCLC